MARTVPLPPPARFSVPATRPHQQYRRQQSASRGSVISSHKTVDRGPRANGWGHTRRVAPFGTPINQSVPVCNSFGLGKYSYRYFISRRTWRVAWNRSPEALSLRRAGNLM
eukprot:577814-Pyramimonas_sp.AAC.2